MLLVVFFHRPAGVAHIFRMRIFFDLWPATTNFPLTSITAEVT